MILVENRRSGYDDMIAVLRVMLEAHRFSRPDNLQSDRSFHPYRIDKFFQVVTHDIVMSYSGIPRV